MKQISPQSLAGMLICPVCSNTFADPVLLPCHDVLCRACFLQLPLHAASVKSSLHRQRSCPQCGALCSADGANLVSDARTAALVSLANSAASASSVQAAAESPCARGDCSSPAVRVCGYSEQPLCQRHAEDDDAAYAALRARVLPLGEAVRNQLSGLWLQHNDLEVERVEALELLDDVADRIRAARRCLDNRLSAAADELQPRLKLASQTADCLRSVLSAESRGDSIAACRHLRQLEIAVSGASTDVSPAPSGPSGDLADCLALNATPNVVRPLKELLRQTRRITAASCYGQLQAPAPSSPADCSGRVSLSHRACCVDLLRLPPSSCFAADSTGRVVVAAAGRTTPADWSTRPLPSTCLAVAHADWLPGRLTLIDARLLAARQENCLPAGDGLFHVQLSEPAAVVTDVHCDGTRERFYLAIDFYQLLVASLDGGCLHRVLGADARPPVGVVSLSGDADKLFVLDNERCRLLTLSKSDSPGAAFADSPAPEGALFTAPLGRDLLLVGPGCLPELRDRVSGQLRPSSSAVPSELSTRHLADLCASRGAAGLVCASEAVSGRVSVWSADWQTVARIQGAWWPLGLLCVERLANDFSGDRVGGDSLSEDGQADLYVCNNCELLRFVV